MAELKRVRTPVLEIAYNEFGPAHGPAAILLHGFPYDVHAYGVVAPLLADAGLRVIVPYLRGYGPTRFLSDETPRSGQQGALARDLLELMDALHLKDALLAGYDWGGRAACILAALWPQRVRGLVTCNGYNIQDIAASVQPAAPEQEHRFWYQYYFHTPRGVAGLTQNRRALCRLIWRLWSPCWEFDETEYLRTAESFDNPDFVAVVIHSYRHRYGYAEGDPHYDDIEHQLTFRPQIAVPTVMLHGMNDDVDPPANSADHARFFPRLLERRLVANAGHNLPQEQPGAFAAAVLSLHSAAPQ